MIRKCTAIASIMILILASATGCAGGKGAEAQTSVPPLEDASIEDNAEDRQNQSAGPEQNTPETSGADQSAEAAENGSSSPDTENPAENGESALPDIIIIGGKVRSVSQDSFVISRVLTDDTDGPGSIVIIPEKGSPDEELVTIRCTDSTAFERWVISGGGAGIEKTEAAFSDIQEDGGLEAEGYFEGEELMAEKVIIEIYE